MRCHQLGFSSKSSSYTFVYSLCAPRVFSLSRRSIVYAGPGQLEMIVASKKGLSFHPRMPYSLAVIWSVGSHLTMRQAFSLLVWCACVFSDTRPKTGVPALVPCDALSLACALSLSSHSIWSEKAVTATLGIVEQDMKTSRPRKTHLQMVIYRLWCYGCL